MKIFDTLNKVNKSIRRNALIIKNVSYINPVAKTAEPCDILISDGRVASFAKAGTLNDADEKVIDATGLYACPGFFDIHVHFRDPGFTHKEDIYTGAAAAKRGGYTGVVMMANTDPAIDNEETLSYVQNKGLNTGIHVFTCATVTKGLKGEELTDMDKLKKHGAVGFTDDGIPIMDAELLKKAMIKCKELDVPISLHEEDRTMIKENGINSGFASNHYNLFGSPSEAEVSIVRRDIEIAKETGVKLDVQHVSTAGAVELIRKAHKEGYDNIYAEVTPHHFSLTETALFEYGSNAKMNPPLRAEEDRLSVIEGIKDGTICCIATDHAPHALNEKQLPLTKAPSGIIGLETAFSLGFEKLVKEGHISIFRLIELLAVGPRSLYNMKCPAINEGDPADIAIFSMSEKWVFDKSVSRSFNTPFAGREMTGKIKYTICGGRIVYEDV